MTFLTTRYSLAKSLTAKDLERLRGLTTHYGIHGVSIEGETLVVEYDASRMSEAETLGCVRRAGIAVKPEKDIPSGAIDHTGEFKDFAWPTTGLSPANQSPK
jgi:hypothetical protein